MDWLDMAEEVIQLFDKFRKDALVSKLLCDWSDSMEGTRIPGRAPMEAEDLKNEIDLVMEAAGGEPESEELLLLLYVGEMIQRELAGIKIAYPGQSVLQTQSIRRFIKMLRQEYWLSWVEDLFCCKVEQAFQLIMAGLPAPDPEQRLFIVVFHEFCFDYKLGAVYKETAYRFIHGLIRRDISRTGSKMKSMIQLSSTLPAPNREVLFFGGTIFWKEKRIIYNLAPVFFKGRCWFLWEKQTISHEDGKSHIVRHRHPMAFGDNATVPAGSGFQAGSLTREFLRADTLSMRPYFAICMFGVKINFAITICLDMQCPEILGNVDVDIHVLMAKGMPAENNLQNIRARRIFLYCDKHYPATAMYKLGDPQLWGGIGRLFCKWKNIDVDKMLKRSDTANHKNAVKGIYIAENVEDL